MTEEGCRVGWSRDLALLLGILVSLETGDSYCWHEMYVYAHERREIARCKCCVQTDSETG